MGANKWVVESRELLSMLMVQVFATGMQLLSRVILSEGTFIFALMAYRHVIGALCVFPFAFFWERGKAKNLSWLVLFWLFMNALTGISMAMGLFYYGLRDTTATYATNFLNLIPIITFAVSLIARMEKLGLHTKAGKAKILGAILCVAGAITVSLYKGKAFHIFHQSGHHQHVITLKTEHNWTRGTLFLVGSCLCYGMWFIVQVKLQKVFPYKYWSTMFMCVIAAIQATVVGLCLDRSKSSWKLGWNLQLITIIYSGALATAATFCLLSWAIANRGPTYPSMFNPLALIFVALAEALFLGEEMTVGSLLGMSLIIVGIYSFLYGKNKEIKKLAELKVRAAEAEKVVVVRSSSNSTSHAEDVSISNQREALEV